MTNQVKFKTVLSTFKKGDKPCYRGIVNHNGTVYLADIARNAAARVGMDESVMKFSGELLVDQIGLELKGGKRVEIENLLSGGLSILGTFSGANAPWDKSKNALSPYFYAKGGMKDAFVDAVAVNVTEGNHAQLKRVLDTVSKTEGVIKAGELFEIEGVGLEGTKSVIVQYVTLPPESGQSVDCTCTVEGSTKVTVASLPEMPDIDCTQPVEVGCVDEEGNIFATLEVTAKE